MVVIPHHILHITDSHSCNIGKQHCDCSLYIYLILMMKKNSINDYTQILALMIALSVLAFMSNIVALLYFVIFLGVLTFVFPKIAVYLVSKMNLFLLKILELIIQLLLTILFYLILSPLGALQRLLSKNPIISVYKKGKTSNYHTKNIVYQPKELKDPW